MRTLIAATAALAGAAILSTAATSADKTPKPMMKTQDIHIRDPFILPVRKEKKYYM
jgi:Spy/CpxP family protein refolding chaperone